jgi:hypothetical protein
MNEEQYTFVQTENTARIISFCKELADKKRWGAVIGAPGTGKSEIKKILTGFFDSLPDKYIRINFECFSSSHLGVGGIMKSMLQQLSPDERIPGSGQVRYQMLRNALIEAVQSKRRVVVLFDESQNMSHTLIREIKQLWEIEGIGYRNLFSIIFFLKNDARFETIFDTNEIGKRVLRTHMTLPGNAERLSIAAAHGLKFANEQAKREFFDMAKTPLDIRSLADSLQMIKGFDGLVQAGQLSKGRALALAKGLEAIQWSQRKLADVVSKEIGKNVSQTEVHRACKGEKTQHSDKILEIAARYIQRAEEDTNTN